MKGISVGTNYRFQRAGVNARHRRFSELYGESLRRASVARLDLKTRKCGRTAQSALGSTRTTDVFPNYTANPSDPHRWRGLTSRSSPCGLRRGLHNRARRRLGEGGKTLLHHSSTLGSSNYASP